jgi:hypothetical protein
MRRILLLIALGVSCGLGAQDDLLNLVEEPADKKAKPVYATFKTVKIGNAQTIETVKKNHLDFRISHRFGNVYDKNNGNTAVNTMFQGFFGFDDIRDVRFSFDYGVTDDITIGIGRSQMNKLLDGSVKWRFLHQTSDFSMPVSVAFFGAAGYSHDVPQNLYGAFYNVKPYETREVHRLNYFSQLIIASKLNDFLSLELLPSYMHRNFILEKVNASNDAADMNSFFSLGFGGRIKMSKRVSFIGDYFYNFSPFYQNNTAAFNPLALGVEIETGGHVFSLFFTNASGLIENNFIPGTSDTWSKGQVKFGFTISRTFAL